MNAPRKAETKDLHELFIALCPNYWGSGLTMLDAVKNARSAGALRKRISYFSLYRLRRYGRKIEFTINAVDGSFTYPKDTTVLKIQTSSAAKQERSKAELYEIAITIIQYEYARNGQMFLAAFLQMAGEEHDYEKVRRLMLDGKMMLPQALQTAIEAKAVYEDQLYKSTSL